MLFYTVYVLEDRFRCLFSENKIDIPRKFVRIKLTIVSENAALHGIYKEAFNNTISKTNDEKP